MMLRAVVEGRTERGFYVRANRGSQTARYGPMGWVGDGVVPPAIGETVIIGSIGIIADDFVILGKLNT